MTDTSEGVKKLAADLEPFVATEILRDAVVEAAIEYIRCRRVGSFVSAALALQALQIKVGNLETHLAKTKEVDP